MAIQFFVSGILPNKIKTFCTPFDICISYNCKSDLFIMVYCSVIKFDIEIKNVLKFHLGSFRYLIIGKRFFKLDYFLNDLLYLFSLNKY